MEYSKTLKEFNKYIENCKETITNTFFKEEDLEGLESPKEESIQNIIKKHRLNMINIKLNHTMRMISQTLIINEKLDIKFDFQLVIKLATLYHDIGRFSQATWSNTFNDNIYKYKNKNFQHHGEEGYYIFLNNDFSINPKYIPIISQTILHHNNIENANHLKIYYNQDIKKLNINDIITGKNILNETELQIASLITHLVADIDKLDILYQYLTKDLSIIQNYIIDNSKDTLDNIAKYWEIDKSEIIKYNNINESLYTPKSIKIPTENMKISKLEIPSYMKEMFYNNNYPDLKILQKDRNWHFITIIWWKLSYFLNNINFSSVLEIIEETKLLDNIENTIPSKYKPLTKEAFNYAKEVLISKTIKENKDNIYIKKRSVIK